MASITQDQLKVLEQTRQRLVQLTQSLGSLVNNITQSQPLPAWSSLQSQAIIISSNLITISQLLNEHHDTLSSLVVYPTPTFPGKTESAVLNQLMRTKLEPRVEDWLAYGRRVGSGPTQARDNPLVTTIGGEDDIGDTKHTGAQLSEAELQELWHWAPIEANMEARRRNWDGDYTIEEKEMGFHTVITGLTRKLDENVEGAGPLGLEEEEDDDDEVEIISVRKKPAGAEFDSFKDGRRVPSRGSSNALPLDEVFRYMMTGAPPRLR
ncbi:mediator of RNA polymerase II transcription subunit 8 [Myotisia sp. PD_48]|nr:mediator of RNA polymerase II transcription subunit 8 [Myotisia sp. PD_48]